MVTNVLEVDLENETIKTGSSEILIAIEIPKMKEGSFSDDNVTTIQAKTRNNINFMGYYQVMREDVLTP